MIIMGKYEEEVKMARSPFVVVKGDEIKGGFASREAAEAYAEKIGGEVIPELPKGD
jgi:hypothetical protein